ncbi:oxidoreductase [Levilactobacillus angrenensis]|uniref:NADH:flavin oxidoreductase n=1 Tax=Levilactobacillus angrenensis TaxID=2486020 RepID=A0ABW1UDR9_9LACO|nr:NADH:flavin oxidoreductase [Levilactobacillus angrenensis]
MGEFQYERPYTFANGLRLRNGFCLAPLDLRTSLFDGAVSQNDCTFYQQHTGQVGLSIVGSLYVAPAGSTVTGSMSIADDQQIAGLKQLAAAIHQQGSRAVVQLVHAGRMTNHFATNGAPVVGPSAIRGTHGQVDQPQALTTAQIDTIVADFGAATQRAIAAGFDGVEIHGANSFLLQQFMSPLSNQRQDDYGGSLVNRMYFPMRVAQRVLTVATRAQRPFVVGYRISPEEIEAGGLSLADNLVLIRALSHLPLSYLSLSLRDYAQPAVTLATQRPVAELVKRFAPQLPLMIAGGIRTHADVARVADLGADLAAVGQQMIVDPAWPKKFRQPETLKGKADWTATTLGIPESIYRYL